MSQSVAIKAGPLGLPPLNAGSAMAALRFLATDRIGIFALAWAALAFGVRPVLMAAHGGAGGGLFETLRGAVDATSFARVTALSQWASFAGCLAIAAMTHVRLADIHRAEPAALTKFGIAAGYAALLAGAYLLFLWTPTTVLTLMSHDSFIFMDATYRIDLGQIPSVDFPTALGAACLYLPALGAWLAGGYAGSVEIASVLVALALGLACALAGMKRYPPLVSAILVAIIFLVAVPAALLEGWGGDTATILNGKSIVLADNLTWAMFYNRWGWAGLIALFAFLAPRQDRKASMAEAGAIAGVLAFLFYLKLTYFIVGAGAACVYAVVNDKPVRTLLAGVGATLALVLLVGLLTGNLVGYLRDVAQAAMVSGGRNTLIPIVRKNLQDILLACAPMAIVAATGKLTWRDALACGYMLAGSLYVINQNAQLHTICSLICLGAYGVARVRENTEGGLARLAATGAFLMMAAAPVLESGMILMDQANAARREETRAPMAWSHVPALQGVYIPERESALGPIEAANDVQERRELLSAIGSTGRRQDLRQGEYMEVLMAGVADLKRVMKPGESVVQLDMSNPLEFMVGARPARGAWLTLHGGRTVNRDVHPDPAAIFADADHVMIGRISMIQPTADLMKELYGDWLTAHYQERVETAYWIRYSHRKPASG